MAVKYLRAARQRFASAELLLRHNLTPDSVYIAGYVSECALKALILRRTPPGRFDESLSRISRGATGHDLEFLKSVLKDFGCRLPMDVAKALSRVVSWSTDLRYEVGLLQYVQGRLFLDATKVVLDWVIRSW